MNLKNGASAFIKQLSDLNLETLSGNQISKTKNERFSIKLQKVKFLINKYAYKIKWDNFYHHKIHDNRPCHICYARCRCKSKKANLRYCVVTNFRFNCFLYIKLLIKSKFEFSLNIRLGHFFAFMAPNFLPNLKKSNELFLRLFLFLIKVLIKWKW